MRPPTPRGAARATRTPRCPTARSTRTPRIRRSDYRRGSAAPDHPRAPNSSDEYSSPKLQEVVTHSTAGIHASVASVEIQRVIPPPWQEHGRTQPSSRRDTWSCTSDGLSTSCGDRASSVPRITRMSTGGYPVGTIRAPTPEVRAPTNAAHPSCPQKRRIVCMVGLRGFVGADLKRMG